MNKKLLITLIAFTIFLNPVSAIDFEISPSGSQQTAAEWGEDNLQSRGSISVTNNNFGANMDCTLYQNSQNVDEVTNIPEGETKDLSIGAINIPSQGTGTEDINFEVYCEDTLGGSDSKYTSANIWYPINPYFELSPSTSQTTLGWGETTQETVTINNRNEHFGLDCTVTKEGSNIGSVSVGEQRSESVSYTISAPNSGSGTKNVDISAQCQSTYDGEASVGRYETTKSETISIEYPTQQQSTAQSQIDTAESLINSASSSIEDAEDKIDEANNAGASVTQAQERLEAANSGLDDANTYISQADSSFSSGNYQDASSKARQAQNSAQNAENSANNAKSAAEAALEELKEERK